MRELKFRVWCKDSLQWVNDNTRFDIFNGELSLGSGDPWVFQQFTGLLDSEGKEIYEGDVIKIIDGHETFWVEVVYEIGMFCGLWKNPLWYHEGKCEVVGNIFENPELLKP